ncbi:hypothetical protein SAMN05444745_1421 [Arthrobacter sp. OV608]|nr:hypothetical protein SAMN05444745_1421 [Arthrobacter sp. OV608]
MEFAKESVVFTREASPVANLMLSVVGAFAEFDAPSLGEHERESLVLAKQRGASSGPPNFRREAAVYRKPSLPVPMGSAARRFTSTCVRTGLEV